MKGLSHCFLFAIIGLWSIQTNAQEYTEIDFGKLEPISEQNICQLEPVAVLDTGLPIVSMALSPNGSLLATGQTGENGDIRLWNSTTGEQVARLVGHERLVSDLAFSPSGTTLASASRDETVRIWDLTTYSQTFLLQGFGEWVNDLAFTPDGMKLITASAGERALQVWGTAGYTEEATLTQNVAVNHIAIRPNGSQLFFPESPMQASASGGSLRLIDIASGVDYPISVPVLGFSGDIGHVEFSHNGAMVGAIVPYDHAIRLWSVATGEQIYIFPYAEPFIHDFAFTYDDTLLILAGGELGTSTLDNKIRIWNTASGVEICEVDTPDTVIFGIELDPNNQFIVTGSYNGKITFFGIPG